MELTFLVGAEIQGGDIHKLVRRELGKSQLKLVLKGQCVDTGATVVELQEGGSSLCPALHQRFCVL